MCPGKPGSPITYKADGKVVLALATVPTSTLYTGFNVQGASLHDIVLDGFEISGGPRGVVINAGGNITVRNCYVHDVAGIADTYPSAAGFYVTSSGNTVENCRAANIRLERLPPDAGSGFFGACAIYNADCANNTYRNNDFYGHGGDQGACSSSTT